MKLDFHSRIQLLCVCFSSTMMTFKNYFLLLCMYVCLYVYVPACLYVFNMCAGACEDQKRLSHPLELKLQL